MLASPCLCVHGATARDCAMPRPLASTAQKARLGWLAGACSPVGRPCDAGGVWWLLWPSGTSVRGRARPCAAVRGPVKPVATLRNRRVTGRSLSEEQAVRRVLFQGHYGAQLLVCRPARQPHGALGPPPHCRMLCDCSRCRRRPQRCERRLVATFQRRRRTADHRARQWAPSAGFRPAGHPAEAGTPFM